MDIDYYEPLYQGLCASYSTAYLQGSNFYVGNSLKTWIFSLNFNRDKYIYIKGILNEWIKERNYEDLEDEPQSESSSSSSSEFTTTLSSFICCLLLIYRESSPRIPMLLLNNMGTPG